MCDKIGHHIICVQNPMQSVQMNTYQSLPLQKWSFSIKDKDGADPKKQQFAKSMKQSQEMGIVDGISMAIPCSFNSLV